MSTIVRREIQRRIPWPAKVFLRSLLWTPGFLSSTLSKRLISDQSRGVFILSLDVETANDLVHNIDLKSAVKVGLKSRKALWELKRMTEKYEIPVTLLCTGHALLESCDKHQYGIFDWANAKHGFADFWSKKDWFCCDPRTNCEKDPAWYFGDVVKRFLDSAVFHELGSHTFGHIRCDLVEKETFLRDMVMLKEASKCLGKTLVSHAYPWDIPGHVDQLSSLGIRMCRWKGSTIMSSIEKRSGVFFVYESLWGRPYSTIIKKAIDVAIRNKVIFLWMLHPTEIATLFGRKLLDKVFAYVEKKRVHGMLETKTMGGLIQLRN